MAEQDNVAGPAGAAPVACDTLIANGYVLTLDGQRRVFPSGAVAVDGVRIVGVGPEAELRQRFRPLRVIDAGGGVVHPGMIDPHLHTSIQLSRTAFSDDPKVNSFEKFAAWYNNLTDEDEFANALAACAEMVRNGFTCAMEPGTVFEPDMLAAAAEAIGVRISLSDPYVWDTIDGGNTMAERLPRAPATPKRAAEQLGRQLYRNKAKDSLIHAHVCIYGSGSTSEALELAAKRCADANGTILNQHQNFMPNQVAIDDRRFGGKPVLVRFAELGLLAPNVSFTHMNVIRDEEIEPIVASGMSIVWQPGNYQYYAIAKTEPQRMPELMARGVNVTLCVDAAKIWTFGEMARIAYLCARQAGHYISSETLMEMQTIGAARAVGLAHEIGSLEVGKRADIVVRDPDLVEGLPAFNPVMQLIMLSQSRSVATVLCNGRVILKDRRLALCSESWVHQVARTSIARLAERLDLRPGTRWTARA